MVRTCWSHHGRHLLQRRTRRSRHLGISRLPDERRPLLRNETGRPLLYRPRPRQLGRRRPTLRLPPFPRRGALRRLRSLPLALALALALALEQEPLHRQLLLRPAERHILHAQFAWIVDQGELQLVLRPCETVAAFRIGT